MAGQVTTYPITKAYDKRAVLRLAIAIEWVANLSSDSAPRCLSLDRLWSQASAISSSEAAAFIMLASDPP